MKYTTFIFALAFFFVTPNVILAQEDPDKNETIQGIMEKFNDTEEFKEHNNLDLKNILDSLYNFQEELLSTKQQNANLQEKIESTLLSLKPYIKKKYREDFLILIESSKTLDNNSRQIEDVILKNEIRILIYNMLLQGKSPEEILVKVIEKTAEKPHD